MNSVLARYVRLLYFYPPLIHPSISIYKAFIIAETVLEIEALCSFTQQTAQTIAEASSLHYPAIILAP